MVCGSLLALSLILLSSSVARAQFVSVSGSVTPSGGGTFKDNGTGIGIGFPGSTISFNNGTTFRWQATPTAGFVFVNWTGSFGTSTANPWNVGSPCSNCNANIVANFKGPPSITSGNAATFLVGSNNTFTITTSGGGSPAITRNGTLPAGVTFVDNGNGTATISGNRSVAFSGT